MTKQEERREYFRLDDEVELEYKIIDPSQPLSDYPFGSGNTSHMEALAALENIDSNNASLFGRVKHGNPEVAEYFEVINRKLDLITRLLQGPRVCTTQKINLSAGGLAFHCDEPLAVTTMLAIKLIMYPSYQGIITRANVIACQSTDNEESPYRVSLEFVGINEDQQQIIMRHLFQKQSEHIRKKKQDEKNQKK